MGIKYLRSQLPCDVKKTIAERPKAENPPIATSIGFTPCELQRALFVDFFCMT
jgi:hypothetical protein